MTIVITSSGHFTIVILTPTTKTKMKNKNILSHIFISYEASFKHETADLAMKVITIF